MVNMRTALDRIQLASKDGRSINFDKFDSVVGSLERQCGAGGGASLEKGGSAMAASQMKVEALETRGRTGGVTVNASICGDLEEVWHNLNAGNFRQ
jgi:hypothetical protein